VLVEEVGAFPLILLGENIESMCQNGALMEERAIPGAYSSACMNLSERIVPLPKLTERNKKDGTIVITQQAGGSGQTGKTLWNSGLLLSRLLDELVEKLLVLPESRSFWSNQSIIELGCGTALGSITAHKLGAKKVLATDGNLEVVNLAKMNIDLNVPSGNDSVESIEARPLQWGLLDAMDYCESASLVLGADLTYNAGSWRVLAETMATVLTLDGNVLYISLGHEGFNVNAEMDGFLSVAKAVGLIQTPDLNGVDVSQLLQNSLTNAEKKILEQSGGARVIILKRRPTLSKAETQKSEQ
jgi:predicted nicotinamide N-methyase